MALLLPDLLVMDHRRIQSLSEQLKAECKKERVNEAECFNLFRTLKAFVKAHSKAEEYTIYALFEDNKLKAHEDLRDFVFEGYEEHDLVDLLMKEMGQAEEVTHQWKAKLSVVTELLEKHINDEEKDFLPKVRAVVGQEELLDLGVVYTRERDEIFAKKSGLKPTPPVGTVKNTSGSAHQGRF